MLGMAIRFVAKWWWWWSGRKVTTNLFLKSGKLFSGFIASLKCFNYLPIIMRRKIRWSPWRIFIKIQIVGEINWAFHDWPRASEIGLKTQGFRGQSACLICGSVGLQGWSVGKLLDVITLHKAILNSQKISPRIFYHLPESADHSLLAPHLQIGHNINFPPPFLTRLFHSNR